MALPFFKVPIEPCAEYRKRWARSSTFFSCVWIAKRLRACTVSVDKAGENHPRKECNGKSAFLYISFQREFREMELYRRLSNQWNGVGRVEAKCQGAAAGLIDHGEGIRQPSVVAGNAKSQ
jgi:hypothetical protein